MCHTFVQAWPCLKNQKRHRGGFPWFMEYLSLYLWLSPVAFSCGFLLWLSPVALVSLAVNTLKEPGRERGLLPFLYQSEHSY